KLGQLFQVAAAGNILTDPITVSTSLPVVSTWATAVMNSCSQYSGGCLSGSRCNDFLLCNFGACDGSYMMKKILGPNDCYPNFGDCVGNAEPSTKNGGYAGAGTEWIEVQIGAVPLFVSSIEIFETISPGMV